MAKWLITWINGGKFEGKEVLPASYVSEAISSQMVSSGGLPSKEYPANIYLPMDLAGCCRHTEGITGFSMVALLMGFQL
jgi:hypothetical protein